jgi:hypothetical protein
MTRCGGNGGGDGVPVDQRITYTGKTAPVVITTTNAPTLIANVLFGGETVGDVPIAATVSGPDTAMIEVPAPTERVLSVFHFSMDNIIGTRIHGYNVPSAETINETYNCESGYYTVQGNLDDQTGLGTLTFDFVNCLDMGITMDGKVIATVNIFDHYNLHINITMDFVLLTMVSSNYNVSISGPVIIDDSISGNTAREVVTKNHIEKNNTNEKMYKYQDFNVTAQINDIYSTSSGGTIVYSGTPAVMYDSLHGSLVVETIAPLSFSRLTLMYPDSGGQLLLIGDNSRIQLTVESGRHVLLEFDMDGSAGYETVRYALWTELYDSAKLDLKDTDGDGMHDSWEQLYGLDANANDAAGDLDGDGLTNLQEYQQGYNPNDPLSPGI